MQEECWAGFRAPRKHFRVTVRRNRQMTKQETGYRWLDHTADVGAILRAETLEALFETAAEALTELITDPCTIDERVDKAITLHAPEHEQLLIRWLTELIALFEIEGIVFHRFSVVSVDKERFVAHAFGEPFDAKRHPFRTAVKAATYHQLALKQTPGGWKATVIFDV